MRLIDDVVPSDDRPLPPRLRVEPSAPPRILLAEDDDAFRRLVATTLRRAGFDVVEVRDGVQLSTLLVSQLLAPDAVTAIDLVISDVRMPGQSGLSALAELRQRDWSTPVVLMTAFGDDSTHAEAARLGASAMLDKPFSLAALRELVRSLLPLP